MKLLTLNTSSMIGFDPEKQLKVLTQALSDGSYDVVALQEVNQLNSAEEVPIQELDSYIPCQDRVPVKKGNFAFQISEALKNSGQIWYWSWLPVHIGYNHFDEGVAVMTRHPIRKTHAFYLSGLTAYDNYKTRMALGIQSVFTGEPAWFYSVQFGWWDDPEEPFSRQWDRFMEKTGSLDTPVYVMGDFSAPTDLTDQGYSYLMSHSDFTDTFDQAEYKDSGITITGTTDEWTDPQNREAMRADLILTNTNQNVLSSHVVFRNDQYQRISDHFGLEVTFGESSQDFKRTTETRIPEFASRKTVPAPLAIIKTSGPMVVRTRRVRLMNDDPFQLIRETFREAARDRGIMETILFGDDETGDDNQ
ncbi:MAG: endonuclease/exonuclease/phosphatase family protein [Eubacteriaceae bacterium]|jgi:maltose 6'-phosphate phosphatase